MERPESRFGSATTLRPRRRPRPYRHCAASVRQKKKACHSWLRKRYFGWSWQCYFLAQSSEARIVFVPRKKRGIVENTNVVVAVRPRTSQPFEHTVRVPAQGIDARDKVGIGICVVIDQGVERRGRCRWIVADLARFGQGEVAKFSGDHLLRLFEGCRRICTQHFDGAEPPL